MKVGIVYELQEEYAPGENAAPDSNAELASEYEIQYLVKTLERLGYQVYRIGSFDRLLRFIVGGGVVDLVFNYAAGLWGRAREAQVPALLEALRIPYTGADPFTLVLCLDKAVTKRLWQSAGLPTLDFCLVSDITELEQRTNDLPNFPLFVKPAHEGSSKGISVESLVTSKPDLYKRVAYILTEYQQPALIEAYLPGREFDVGILGSGRNASVLGVVELAHGSKRILDPMEKETFQAHRFLPVEETALRNELSELGRQAYLAVDCQTIGRVDIRLDQAGRPHLLEINPNPGLHPVHSVMPAIGRLAGLSYSALIAEILHLAAERWSLNISEPLPQRE